MALVAVSRSAYSVHLCVSIYLLSMDYILGHICPAQRHMEPCVVCFASDISSLWVFPASFTALHHGKELDYGCVE